MVDDSLPVAPLDAYVTAQPNEPTWTVQGGDPLGPPLLRLWAVAARVRAGILTGKTFTSDYIEGILEIARDHPPENDRECDELLKRATQTEIVSWNMDDYARGTFAAQGQNTPAENSLPVDDRLDLHDHRVNASRELSNMISILEGMLERFGGRGYQFWDEEECTEVIDLQQRLAAIRDNIEPRRLFKQR